MKYPKCQADNTDTARFCSNCATSLTSADQAEPLVTKTMATSLKSTMPAPVLPTSKTADSR